VIYLSRFGRAKITGRERTNWRVLAIFMRSHPGDGLTAIGLNRQRVTVRAQLNAVTQGLIKPRELLSQFLLSVCGHRLDAKRIDFLENGLKPLLQLSFGSWFSFCSCKLPIIGNGAPVKVGRFYQQVSLRIILGGHDSIL